MVYVLFAAMAVVTILVAVQLSKYADVISQKTKFGGMLIGSVLLALATSLPEVTTSVTSVIIQNPDLAVGNLLGSNLFNMLIIAAFDLYYRKQKMFQDPFIELRHYAGLAITLSFVVLLGLFFRFPHTLLGVGLDAWLLFGLYGGGMWFISRSKQDEQVHPNGMGKTNADAGPDNLTASLQKDNLQLNPQQKDDPHTNDHHQTDEPDPEVVQVESKVHGAIQPHANMTVRKALLGFSVSAVIILISGSVLTVTGDRIAEITGIGSTFVGSFLIAASTSLPEAVSVYVAIALTNYRLAIGSVLSSNLFNMLILGGTDAAFQQAPLLASAADAHQITAFSGMLLIGLILYALRREKTTRLTYVWPSAGVVVLYFVFSYMIFFAS